MLAGHFTTALIAKQKFPKGILLYFLIISQLQDLLWFLFHYLGLEKTSPQDAFDATIPNMYADMLYSHDLIPQVIWLVLVYLIGRLLFKNNKIALVGSAILLSHYVLDFFSGHPHFIFGEESHQFGLGLYDTMPYLAIVIEILFIVASLGYFFFQESKNGVKRTVKNKAAIIVVFIYGVIFMLSTATSSFREILNIPDFDLGFNTLVPTLLFTYITMIWVLNYFVPKFTIDKK